MICPKCGVENPEGYKVCIQCGMDFTNPTSSRSENNQLSSLSGNANNSTGQLNTINNQIKSNLYNQTVETASQQVNTVNQPINTNGVVQTNENNMNNLKNETVNLTMNSQNTANNITNSNTRQTVNTPSFTTSYNEQSQINDLKDTNKMSQGMAMNLTNSQIHNSQQKVHNSIIRKTIKKDAKYQKKSILMGWQTLIIVFIVGLFTFTIMNIITESQANLSNVSSLMGIIVGFTTITVVSFSKMIIILAIALIFIQIIYFGMTQVALQISRGKTVKFFDVITYPFKKIKSFLKYLAVIIIWSIITSVICLIPYAGALIALILFVFICPSIVITVYKLADENYQKVSLIEVVKTSFYQTKGHKMEFYALIISSIGWIILSLLTCGILAIWVNPYITMIITNYYRYVIGEAEFNDAKPGVSNATIIVAGIIAYIVVILMVIGLTLHISNQSNQINNNSDYNYEDDYNSTYIKEMNGIRLYVPSAFTHSSNDNYDDIYVNNVNTAFIGTTSINFVNINSLDDYIPDFITSKSEQNFTCQTPNYQNINGNSWAKIYCASSTQIAYVYFSLKDSTVYIVDFTMNNDVMSLYSPYITDIEKSLDLID